MNQPGLPGQGEARREGRRRTVRESVAVSISWLRLDREMRRRDEVE